MAVDLNRFFAKSPRVFRSSALLVAALATTTTLTSCASGDGGSQRDLSQVAEAEFLSSEGAQSSSNSKGDNKSEPAKKSKKLAPKISVKDGAENVDPLVPVTVTSLGKGLKTVTMTNETGKVIAEKLSADGMVWSSDEELGYSRTYTIVAEDENGKSTQVTFKTPVVNGTTAVSLSPLDGSTVGVGQTIAFRFGAAIQDRKAVQDALTIKTSPKTEGAFYWLNDFEVRWRPREYWKPGTKVSVKADIKGKDLGGGIWGTDNNAAKFTIGDRVVTQINDATKTMTVFKNGKPLRTIPVSLGRDGEYATPNGTYMIGDEHDKLLMDSTTFGLALENGGYKTKVDYATQMSYSGIYVHSAPWSVWAQGSQNTSHGCVNVTPEAAQWYQTVVKRGDIVEVVNTSGPQLSGFDGLGDWNIPWKEWKKGNASSTS